MNTLSVEILGLLCGFAIVVGLIFLSFLRRRNKHEKTRNLADLAGALHKKDRAPVPVEDMTPWK